MAISHITLMQTDDVNSADIHITDGGEIVVINAGTEYGVRVKVKDLFSSIQLLQAAYWDENGYPDSPDNNKEEGPADGAEGDY